MGERSLQGRPGEAFSSCLGRLVEQSAPDGCLCNHLKAALD